MTQDIKDKIAKVYELVNRGATEGERAAAKKALDRLMEKYKLDESDLNGLDKKKYYFKYTSRIEYILLAQIMKIMIGHAPSECTRYTNIKAISTSLRFIDYVTVDSAYEYFRRHMRAEWKKICMPVLVRVRKNKNKTKKRSKLQDRFITTYCIKSNLVNPEDIETREVTGSALEMADLMSGIEGGQYNKQVVGGLLLTE